MLPFSLGNRCVHPGVQGIGFQKTVQNHESTFDLEHGLQNCAKDRKQDKVQLGHGFCNCFF